MRETNNNKKETGMKEMVVYDIAVCVCVCLVKGGGEIEFYF